MKRCIETHTVPSFGEIPVGSLWDDDSPYLEDISKFEDAVAPRAGAGRAAKPKES